MIADALLVIDLQKGVCHDEVDIDHLEELVSKVNGLVQSYRENQKKIIFIQHHELGLEKNSEKWQLLDELENRSTDFYVDKIHANSFFKTNLNEILESNQIQSLEICGAQTQFCIDSTVKMAHGIGYDICMQSGATTTYDNEFMTAKDTIAFYEDIWKDRFLNLY